MEMGLILEMVDVACGELWKGLDFIGFGSSMIVFVEEHDIRCVQVSYLTALEKYQEEGHQIVYAYDTYMVHQESNETGAIYIFFLIFTYKSTLSPSK